MSEAPADRAAPKSAERPLSPHLWNWRWHVTMLTSILHRVTGVGLYLGAIVLSAWAFTLMSGPGPYLAFKGLLASPIGLLVLIGLTFSFFYHLANGVRHLVWDFGKGFAPKTADATAFLVIGIGIVATIAVWAVVFMGGLS